jgi:hypothetical protein
MDLRPSIKDSAVLVRMAAFSSKESENALMLRSSMYPLGAVTTPTVDFSG